MQSIGTVLNTIEARWKEVATRVIAGMLAAHSDEAFYAAGFWNLYADYTRLGVPCFAMNTEASLDDEADRWIPPEWQFDCIHEASDAMSVIYQQLSEILSGESEQEWDAVIEGHKQLLARVCRSVTATVIAQLGDATYSQLSPAFIVGIFEENDGGDEYDRLAKLSIHESVFDSLGLPVGECEDD